jgi:GntR family transcriptional repressor for pyruvate dehydrogenase complex
MAWYDGCWPTAARQSSAVDGALLNTTGPAGGARVADVSIDHAISFLRNFFYFNPVNARQLYQVRLQIAPELGASVVGHLTDEHFAALEDNVQLQEATAIAVDTWRAHREAEKAFHDLVASACPNPLRPLAASFINQAIRTSIGLTQTPSEFDAAASFTHANISCHRVILNALRRGNEAKVRRLMREHIAATEPYVNSVTAHVRVTVQARILSGWRARPT